MFLRFAFVLLGFAVMLNPSAEAQISTGIGVAYHNLEDIDRWGIGGAVYIPVAGHAFEFVPNFEYYFSNWSVGGQGIGSDTSNVYAVSADLHANLPALGDRLRAYIGTGATYAGSGVDAALGLNLTSGFHLRAQGWRFFPYGQATYRLMPEFQSTTALDTFFFRAGIRIVL